MVFSRKLSEEERTLEFIQYGSDKSLETRLAPTFKKYFNAESIDDYMYVYNCWVNIIRKRKTMSALNDIIEPDGFLEDTAKAIQLFKRAFDMEFVMNTPLVYTADLRRLKERINNLFKWFDKDSEYGYKRYNAPYFTMIQQSNGTDKTKLMMELRKHYNITAAAAALMEAHKDKDQNEQKLQQRGEKSMRLEIKMDVNVTACSMILCCDTNRPRVPIYDDVFNVDDYRNYRGGVTRRKTLAYEDHIQRIIVNTLHQEEKKYQTCKKIYYKMTG